MVSLPVESNQTTSVSSCALDSLRRPFPTLFRFFFLLFFGRGLSLHYSPPYPPFTRACARPRHLFDYEDCFPLLNFPLAPLVSKFDFLVPRAVLDRASVLAREGYSPVHVIFYPENNEFFFNGSLPRSLLWDVSR